MGAGKSTENKPPVVDNSATDTSIKKPFSFSSLFGLSTDKKVSINESDKNPPVSGTNLTESESGKFSDNVSNNSNNLLPPPPPMNSDINNENLGKPGVPGGKPVNKVIVLKFHMKTCPACIEYKSVWNGMIKENKNSNVEFYSIENKKIEEGMLEKFNKKFKTTIHPPNAFPTLVIFNSSNPSKVHELESRDPEVVKKWISKMSSPSKGGSKTVKKNAKKNNKSSKQKKW